MALRYIQIDGHVFQGMPGTRVLDLVDDWAEVQGVQPLPTRCRAGHCQTCAVRVVAGDEGLLPATKLERAELDVGPHAADAQVRLGCQLVLSAKPARVVLHWIGAQVPHRKPEPSSL